MDAQATVRAFCDAVPARDVKALLAFLAEDCVYHNMPLEPVRGHEAIEGVLRQFIDRFESAEFEILNLVGDGPTVLTERVDRFRRADGGEVVLPVMGAFEVGPDGLIRAWRDYFDLQAFVRQAG
jgi:limonene-1,2-epoxide hydrolase